MAEQTFKRGVAAQFPISLVSAADPQTFQANPTLAVGDVKVSKDGGARTNITTLPTVSPAGSTDVVVVLSASEMDCDMLVVEFIDAAGAEWLPAKATILPQTYSLADVAAAADPLLNPVPGAYASGTAGAALGRIGSAQVTIVSPVSDDGTEVELVAGDDYLNADGRALVFTRASGSAEWPDLTGATVRFKNGAFAAVTGTVVVPTGAGQQVRFDVARTLTAGLRTTRGYDIEATLAGVGATVVTLITGTLKIVRGQE